MLQRLPANSMRIQALARPRPRVRAPGHAFIDVQNVNPSSLARSPVRGVEASRVNRIEHTFAIGPFYA